MLCRWKVPCSNPSHLQPGFFFDKGYEKPYSETLQSKQNNTYQGGPVVLFSIKQLPIWGGAVAQPSFDFKTKKLRKVLFETVGLSAKHYVNRRERSCKPTFYSRVGVGLHMLSWHPSFLWQLIPVSFSEPQQFWRDLNRLQCETGCQRRNQLHSVWKSVDEISQSCKAASFQ